MEETMKKRISKIIRLAALAASVSCFAGSLFEERAGMVFSGSYWHRSDEQLRVSTGLSHRYYTNTDVRGFGGWLKFFSGAGERGVIEFDLGGAADVRLTETGLFEEYTDVQVVAPILLGYQFLLFNERNLSAFQPYVSAGAGPYIITRVQTNHSSLIDDEVSVRNHIKGGFYGGFGGYFTLTEWLAVNGEMRYHLVNFNPDNDFSGLEVALGVAISWSR